MPSYGYDGLYYKFVNNPDGMPIWINWLSCPETANSLKECAWEIENYCERIEDVGEWDDAKGTLTHGTLQKCDPWVHGIHLGTWI